MNWQLLGPQLHAAAKAYLKNPSFVSERELQQFIRIGNFAGNHTEWLEPDELGFVPEPPDSARDA